MSIDFDQLGSYNPFPDCATGAIIGGAAGGIVGAGAGCATNVVAGATQNLFDSIDWGN